MQGQNCVHPRGRAQDVQGAGIARAVRVPQQVDGIGPGPTARQDFVQGRPGAGAQLRQPAPAVQQGIRRQHAGAAAVGEDGQPVAAGRAGQGQGRHGIEQFLQAVHSQQAGAAKGRVLDGIGPGHRPRVRQDRPRPGRGVAGLDQDDGLEPGGGAGGGEEFARRPQALDEQQDGADPAIQGQVVEQVAKIQVHHVAEGDQMGEADPPRQGPVEHRGDEGARLGHEGQPPRAGETMAQAGVESLTGHHEPEAVGTQQAQPMAPGDGQDLRATVQTGGVAALAEARAGEDGGAGPQGTELVQEGGRLVRWRGEDGQIRSHRQGRQFADAGQAAEAGGLGARPAHPARLAHPLGTDGPEGAGKAGSGQITTEETGSVPRQGFPQGVLATAGAYQNNGFGVEQAIEGRRRHGGSLAEWRNRAYPAQADARNAMTHPQT